MKFKRLLEEKNRLEILKSRDELTQEGLEILAELTQALQLQQGGVMQSVFKVMAGNSELERFKSREKAEEICEYYRGNGFPNARVEETVV